MAQARPRTVEARAPGRSRPRDGCVVPTQPLKEMLDEFVTRWQRDRPPTAGRFAAGQTRTEVAFVGAVEWLVSETGLGENTIERVLYARSRTTELWMADAIVQAIDRPFALHDGTLEIRPNPQAPRAARASCCGGSLTGALEPA